MKSNATKWQLILAQWQSEATRWAKYGGLSARKLTLGIETDIRFNINISNHQYQKKAGNVFIVICLFFD